MTPEPNRAVNLDTEIKELEVQLRQAGFADKERIASQLSSLRNQRRNQNRGALSFRFSLHRPTKNAPITTGGAKDD